MFDRNSTSPRRGRLTWTVFLAQHCTCTGPKAHPPLSANHRFKGNGAKSSDASCARLHFFVVSKAKMVNTRASWRLTLKRKAAQRQPALTPAHLVLPRRFFSSPCCRYNAKGGRWQNKRVAINRGREAIKLITVLELF